MVGGRGSCYTNLFLLLFSKTKIVAKLTYTNESVSNAKLTRNESVLLFVSKKTKAKNMARFIYFYVDNSLSAGLLSRGFSFPLGPGLGPVVFQLRTEAGLLAAEKRAGRESGRASKEGSKRTNE